MGHDLRFACRMLWKTRSFTFMTVAMLALGIGANTAVFSILYGALLRPLPYRDPQRLVDILDESRRESSLSKLFDSYADFREYRDHSRSFDSIAAATWATRSPILTGHGAPRRVTAILASRQFFDLLGIRPALGRDFIPEDERGCTVILAHSYWAESFGGDPGVPGRSIALDRQSCTIVGVMPASFSFYPGAAQMWRLMTGEVSAPVFIIGRLRPAVTTAQAESELSGLHAGIRHSDAIEREFRPVVNRLQDDFTWLAGRNLRVTLWTLMAAVAMVLLIACLNVGSLLLGRSGTRARELAVRAALGGGRARLVRQLLTEGAVLALLGGGFGVLIADAAVRAFRGLSPVELPAGAEIGLSGPALWFTASVCLITVLLFALAPAWRGSRVDLHEALKTGGRGGISGGGRDRLARVLVAAETGLSVALLAGAGLLLESVFRMGREPLGFDPHALYTAGLSLPPGRYASAADRLRLVEELERRVAALPGVQSAAAGSAVPPFYSGNGALEIQGIPFSRDTAVHNVSQQWTSPSYLRTLGIELRRGRAFDAHDREGSPPVALVDENLVREYFRGADPIGRRIRVGSDEAQWSTVVGVVSTIKRSSVFREMSWSESPTVFLPLAQQTPVAISLAVRAAGRAAPSRPAIEAALAALDPDAAIGFVEPAETSLGRLLAYPRFRAAVFGGFAAFALLLAAAGLYAVVSQSVSRRTQEIGVRMALGAQQADIVRMIAGQGGRPVLAGLAIGLAAAIVAARWLSSLLYGVRPRDPLTLAVVSIVLLLAAAVALAAPARRAAATNPLDALRQE